MKLGGFVFLFLFSFFSIQAHAAGKRTILVTGFWPPTNEMLRPFSPNPLQNQGKYVGENWEGSGYDVVAYFPEFSPADSFYGSGDFRVDFTAVYNDFMRLTAELEPVAILSFGQGAGPWEIEGAYPAYFANWFEQEKLPSHFGEKLLYPVPESLKAKVDRRSSLPMEEIQAAVNALGDRGLSAWIDGFGGAGDFLCGFTGYLGAWYHATHPHNLAAGFIHVSGSERQARASFEATLRATIQSLERKVASGEQRSPFTVRNTEWACPHCPSLRI